LPVKRPILFAGSDYCATIQRPRDLNTKERRKRMKYKLVRHDYLADPWAWFWLRCKPNRVQRMGIAKAAERARKRRLGRAP
jgi:hypothetical protein